MMMEGYNDVALWLLNYFLLCFHSLISSPLNEQVFETKHGGVSPGPGKLNLSMQRSVRDGPRFIWALRAAVNLRLQDMIKASSDPPTSHLSTHPHRDIRPILLFPPKSCFQFTGSHNLRFAGLLYIVIYHKYFSLHCKNILIIS